MAAALAMAERGRRDGTAQNSMTHDEVDAKWNIEKISNARKLRPLLRS
jgi:hypothetical protein